MGKRIAVTGATSMIGAALIDAAVGAGAEVYAVIRPDSKRKDRLVCSPLVHVIECPIDALADIEGLPENLDAFYHFAWIGTGRTTRDDPMIQSRNIRYTLDAVALANRVGCKRFIGAGSQAEYGRVEGVISDTTPVNPTMAYGMAKLAAGLLSRKLCQQLGMQHIWARIFSVYGINDNDGTMINYAIDQFTKGDIARFSAATQMWNYLFEADAGMMFYLLGCRDVESGVYCVANPESRVLKCYIEEMRNAYGADARCAYESEAVGGIGLEVDMDKTIRAIGYVPTVSFEEGIRKVISHRKAMVL